MLYELLGETLNNLGIILVSFTFHFGLNFRLKPEVLTLVHFSPISYNLLKPKHKALA